MHLQAGSQAGRHKLTWHKEVRQPGDRDNKDRDRQGDTHKANCQIGALVLSTYQRDLWVRHIGVGKVVDVAF